MSLIIMPSIIIGLVIGIYEAILLHRDVTVGTHRFGHTIHALIFAVIATFASMNASFVLQNIPAIAKIPFVGTEIGLRVLVALIAIIKIHGVSFAIKSTIGGSSLGLAETWTHALIIGALIGLAPSIYPFVKPSLPVWARD